LTGQRITKVVRTLQHIEERIDSLVQAFGVKAGIGDMEAKPRSAPKQRPSGSPDDDLLSGPSLPGQAIDQDEIDRLLASFD